MGERHYHHGNLRAALLDAGRQVLEKNGPSSLSLRGLARATGVAAPSVYNHFAGIEALTLALAEEGFTELGAALRESGTDPLAVGLAYLRFARTNPGLYRLMFGEGRRNDSPEGATLRARRRAAFAPLMELVGSRETALHYWALVHGLASLVIDGQIPLGPDPEVRLREILTRQ
ncbi:TetR/AcrR family transcriptional regulator [Solirhodobacter olei]|uniref:TetR/AcrR family transcriptional regulator n=1 Tax=Solirhodobacter olei TaxID=2493082 RepID=UPI000FDBEA65|nr:TetR/AcrR family transcriptional regulator [Solirhodobacter olei]